MALARVLFLIIMSLETGTLGSQVQAGSSPGVDLASVQELCDLKGEGTCKNICGGRDL